MRDSLSPGYFSRLEMVRCTDSFQEGGVALNKIGTGFFLFKKGKGHIFSQNICVPLTRGQKSLIVENQIILHHHKTELTTMISSSGRAQRQSNPNSWGKEGFGNEPSVD